MIPLARSAHLKPFVAALGDSSGATVKWLLREAQLPAGCLDRPHTLIPVSGIGRFQELCARRTGNEALALVAINALPPRDFCGLERRLDQAPSLLRALVLARRLAPTQASNLRIDLSLTPGAGVWMTFRSLQSTQRVGDWHGTLYVLSLLLKLVRLAEPAWLPSEIRLADVEEPGRCAVLEKALGVRTLSGQSSSGFLVPVSLLKRDVRPFPSTRTVFSTDVIEKPVPTTFASSIQELISSYVVAGDCWLSLEEIAEFAGMSTRTLQRRLKCERTCYLELIDGIRAELARGILKTSDASVADIADRLGYSYQGDLTRAFVRWTGVSPSAYRALLGSASCEAFTTDSSRQFKPLVAPRSGCC